MQDEKPKILVVDDESDTLLYLYDFLTSAGYFVEGSSNPADALEGIRRRAPAVVLADVRMREMDGYELLRRIRAASPKTRVLMMSAYADEVAPAAAAALGAEAFLPKPIRSEELLSVLERLTHEIAG
jgi:CheY-like chemotaxis protein